MVVPEDTFVLDTFTEVYLKVEGAQALTSFTDAYDDKIAEVQTLVEDSSRRDGASSARDEIVQEAEDEIADAEQELAGRQRERRKRS